jgi:iron complex outermembrane receptor protein
MKINGHTVTTGNPALGAAVAVGLAAATLDRRDLSPASKNWSLFAQTEYDLTDTLTLITGLRYSKDTKGVDYTRRQFGRQHGGAGHQPELCA